MKRKFILLPITLTALAPTISLVGCNKPEPKVHNVKVDPSSDTTDINISTPKITLNQKLVIPYKVINQEKELDVDNSWLTFDSSQYPLNTFSYGDNKVTIPASYVTTYDIIICLKAKQAEPEEYNVELVTNKPDAFDKFQVAQKRFGFDIVIEYILSAQYFLDNVVVQAEGQEQPVEATIFKELILIDCTKIKNPYSKITVTLAVSDIGESYYVEPLYDYGFTSFSVIQNEIGKDIILSYKLRNGYDKDEFLIYGGGQTSLPFTINPNEQLITIDHTYISDPLSLINVEASSKCVLESYNLRFSKDDGVNEIYATKNVGGQNIELEYSLEDGYILDKVIVQEDGQEPFEPSVWPDLYSITIDYKKFVDPIAWIDITITSKLNK